MDDFVPWVLTLGAVVGGGHGLVRILGGAGDPFPPLTFALLCGLWIAWEHKESRP